MVRRRAECCCGQLAAVCEGEPIRVTVCHCLNCKRRTGSAIVQYRMHDEPDAVAVPVGSRFSCAHPIPVSPEAAVPLGGDPRGTTGTHRLRIPRRRQEVGLDGLRLRLVR
jgi:hypothetical protein